ncbi:MAG: hypothetical protein HRK26_05290 [Rickettsiaceae bacterium H1]|nr:hypothetical protein [Rickettsiaceae bacterium H1]
MKKVDQENNPEEYGKLKNRSRNILIASTFFIIPYNLFANGAFVYFCCNYFGKLNQKISIGVAGAFVGLLTVISLLRSIQLALVVEGDKIMFFFLQSAAFTNGIFSYPSFILATIPFQVIQYKEEEEFQNRKREFNRSVVLTNEIKFFLFQTENDYDFRKTPQEKKMTKENRYYYKFPKDTYYFIDVGNYFAVIEKKVISVIGEVTAE